MERWRPENDPPLPQEFDDVEPLDEETGPDEGPLESDADLGWEAEGLLSDHDEVGMPAGRRVFLYLFGALAIFAMLAPVVVIFIF
ncbi:MAG: hypothetical protein WEB00_09650 [Dehalococcoidia bacterium]